MNAQPVFPNSQHYDLSHIDQELKLVACPICQGFGYLVTAAKQHQRCPHCHGHASLFGVYQGNVLYHTWRWNQLSVRWRKWSHWWYLIINTLLLVMIGIGVLCGLIRSLLLLETELGIDISILHRVTLPSTHWLELIALIAIMLVIWLIYRIDQHRPTQPVRILHPQLRLRSSQPDFEQLATLQWFRKIAVDRATSIEVLDSFDRAQELAHELQHHQVTPLHVLVVALETGPGRVFCARLGIASQELTQKIATAFQREQISSGQGIDANRAITQLWYTAYVVASRRQRNSVELLDVLIALTQCDPWVRQIIQEIGIEERTLRHGLMWLDVANWLKQQYQTWKKQARFKPHSVMDRAMTARAANFTETLTTDYTQIATSGGFLPVVGRDEIVATLMAGLVQPTATIVLIGESGTGKTAMVQQVANLMASEAVPDGLKDKRLIVLSVENILGAGLADQIESVLQRIVQEVNRSGNIVLTVEGVEQLAGLRSTGSSVDGLSMLINQINDHCRLIATTTPDAWKQVQETNPALARRCQAIVLPSLDEDNTITALQTRVGGFEYRQQVFFTYQALQRIVHDSSTFLSSRAQPGNALNIMQSVAESVSLRKGVHSLVTEQDVALVMSDLTHLPVAQLTTAETDLLLSLEEKLGSQVIGQTQAVKAIANALRRARSGLRDTSRPLASLLFVGPTGVGKTQTARALSEMYFGHDRPLIELDMSEYQTVESVAQLLGRPGEDGRLTQAITAQPFTVLLLDEFEKAHPDILNIFLQLLSAGRMTNGRGETVDCTHLFVIATSNAGASQVQNAIRAGLNVTALNEIMQREVLPKIFRPELLNRFDDIIVFEPLDQTALEQITSLMIKPIAATLESRSGVGLRVEPAAITALAQAGYNPTLGARPLQRVIQDQVESPIATALLQGQLGRRDVIIITAPGQYQIQRADRL